MSQSLSCVQLQNKWVQMLTQSEWEFTWLSLTVNDYSGKYSISCEAQKIK